jgi:hypothetical protein
MLEDLPSTKKRLTKASAQNSRKRGQTCTKGSKTGPTHAKDNITFKLPRHLITVNVARVSQATNDTRK